jgi:hypothetical protein
MRSFSEWMALNESMTVSIRGYEEPPRNILDLAFHIERQLRRVPQFKQAKRPEVIPSTEQLTLTHEMEQLISILRAYLILLFRIFLKEFNSILMNLVLNTDNSQKIFQKPLAEPSIELILKWVRQLICPRILIYQTPTQE